jgi:hypothetical protein
MNSVLRLLIFVLLVSARLLAQTTIFWQRGFPTVSSQEISRATIVTAMSGEQLSFLDLAGLTAPDALVNTQLLVLPYGSAIPVAAWQAIDAYLEHGGNLLVLGGQPLRVPVSLSNGKFIAGRPQDTYSRAIDLRHTYEVPVPKDAQFSWRSGYSFGETPHIEAAKYFTIEGHLNGLGYMVAKSGTLVAAPVIVLDHTMEGKLRGSRIVALDFQPTAGYWESKDGLTLLKESADYARQGATTLSVETLYSVIRTNETPQITIHLVRPSAAASHDRAPGEVHVDLLFGGKVIDSATQQVGSDESSTLSVPFNTHLLPGFYEVRAVYRQRQEFRDFYQNGFWVADPNKVEEGPVLGVHRDFLTRDGKPFFPVGTNYFTTEENGWDFSGARNASIWEKDFADMASHGVTFVRTGVWMKNAKFIDPDTNKPNERFMRNLEAFLLCAQRHGISVNFTFFAFSPISGPVPRSTDPSESIKNPYVDEDAVHLEGSYVDGVASRFAKVPWLSWDLINEPSFSSPHMIFKGNITKGDPAEVSAWHSWLRGRYQNLGELADAWAQTPEQLGSFDTIPLPGASDLTYERYGNPRQVRALDYNLFAEDMFSHWVRSMVTVIRRTGSKQLINVGQDEGGVTNRVLNQFYGSAGVSFTTNHTYWQDDALLWDSVAAKLPGMPNITGETGYQPAWTSDGTWRYDEFTGLGLTERKWVLGFAAGSSGAMQWDWAREVDFGMERSDGSAKVWEDMMRGFGEFAEKAERYATGFIQPDVAIVLPQSFQLSTSNNLAVEAQQNAVRALYYNARGEAYVVGEYQIGSLGSPKLIILPSPFGLREDTWQAILTKVKAGATLLVTGPFEEDPHMHATQRQNVVGLPYVDVPLTIRRNTFRWPGREEVFTFTGSKTTQISRAQLPSKTDWKELPLGKGKILFSALPIELSDNLESVGDIYHYAMKSANVRLSYTTTISDPGILICPTRFPTATLYVLTSESNLNEISLHDVRSDHDFSGRLNPGRAALLLVSTDGKLLSSYNWRDRAGNSNPALHK